MKNKIQTIDFKGDPEIIQYQLAKSLAKTGFAVLINHGIPKRAFDMTYEAWEGFSRTRLTKTVSCVTRFRRWGSFQ